MTDNNSDTAALADFILRITHEIWEQKQAETLRHYYDPQIVVRSPMSVVVGNEAVIGQTRATQTEFPDRELLGEDVIACGSLAAGGFSSHRILSTATHGGDGDFGAATGRRVRYRVIADCHVRPAGDNDGGADGVIDDEWLVRDFGAICRQTGSSPRDFAEALIRREGGRETAARPFTPASDRAGPYRGAGNDDPAGVRCAEILKRVMTCDPAALSDVVEDEYDRAAELFWPGGVVDSGYAAARLWGGLRASFPGATFAARHCVGRSADFGMSPRAAVRWSLDGEHSGDGYFGKPTGAAVHLMGISHAEFGPRGLRREYVLFDEVAVWKQILLGA